MPRVLTGKKRLFGETVDLTPEHAWTHQLSLADTTAKYTVEIRDASQSVLIRQTEGEYDWDAESDIHAGPQTSYRIPEPDKRTCDDWLELGTELELNGRLLQALDTYKETLSRFPNSFDAARAGGRLAASLLRFEEAKNFL